MRGSEVSMGRRTTRRWVEIEIAGFECCICTQRIKRSQLLFVAPGVRSIKGRLKAYMHKSCMKEALEFAPPDTYEKIRQRVLAGGEFLE